MSRSMAYGGYACRCGQPLRVPAEGREGWAMCARCANRALVERLENLAAELLPGARRDGRWLRCGDLSGAAGGSLALELSGRWRGRWRDFASEENGDALDLVRLAAASGCGGDLDRAMRWACNWLHQPLRPLPPGLRHTSPDRSPPTPEETLVYMRSIWRGSRPLTPAEPAWRYLVETRGIAGLAALGPVPALRSHRALWNAQLRAEMPALVAAIAGADGRFAALHRTYLAGRGGAVLKAPVPEEKGGPKRSIGYYRGGCIPLWPGNSGRSWRDPEPGEAVAITEGIEDGLTLAANRRKLRVVAAVSLSNMTVMALPATIGAVIIATQNDKPGSPAARTLERAVAHFRDDLKRRVFLLHPPARVKDLNELQLEMTGRR
jgi:hypothetical protein